MLFVIRIYINVHLLSEKYLIKNSNEIILSLIYLKFEISGLGNPPIPIFIENELFFFKSAILDPPFCFWKK